jgi:hypothetical protein
MNNKKSGKKMKIQDFMGKTNYFFGDPCPTALRQFHPHGYM